MGIAAIETSYKGYRFRSRLEARWAVFFDALGIAWEYEKEGYDLGEHGWYLPDFWLPEIAGGVWVEIKGDTPSPTEISKAEALCLGTRRGVYICVGIGGDYGICREDFQFEFVSVDTEFLKVMKDDPVEFGGGERVSEYEKYGGSVYRMGSMTPWCSVNGPFDCVNSNGERMFSRARLKIALQKGLSARFEHGENGTQKTSRRRRRTN
jgi:hypothetical protein